MTPLSRHHALGVVSSSGGPDFSEAPIAGETVNQFRPFRPSSARFRVGSHGVERERSAVVRIRTADHPINSRGLYRTELRRLATRYKGGPQIVSQPNRSEESPRTVEGPRGESY